MKIEFLWFDDCPSHVAARRLLKEAMLACGIDAPVDEINASDPVVAERVKFPGSPTIRINGADIEPGFIDPGDYTPRCRLYARNSGLKGVPERRWIEERLKEGQRES